ncbi:MAG: hypothetical protein GX592_12650 [Clostridiales bacterium]|nr:hypothetical protein [Clostridiales bacterium]
MVKGTGNRIAGMYPVCFHTERRLVTPSIPAAKAMPIYRQREDEDRHNSGKDNDGGERRQNDCHENRPEDQADGKRQKCGKEVDDPC